MAQPMEISEPITEQPEVNAVSKLSESRKSQIRNHEAVMKIDKESLDHDWREEVKLSEYYAKFKDDFLEYLSDFASILNGR